LFLPDAPSIGPQFGLNQFSKLMVSVSTSSVAPLEQLAAFGIAGAFLERRAVVLGPNITRFVF
jgi:hypothetical protein